MNNMCLTLRDIVKVKQIALAGCGNTEDSVGLRKQLPLGFDDGGCIREQMRKPLMNAVVVGDHDAHAGAPTGEPGRVSDGKYRPAPEAAR